MGGPIRKFNLEIWRGIITEGESLKISRCENQPMGTRWIAALNYFEIYRARMGHEQGKYLF